MQEYLTTMYEVTKLAGFHIIWCVQWILGQIELEFYDSKFWLKKCSQHSFVPILQFLDWESSIIWNHFFLFNTDSGESFLLTNKSIKFQSFLIKNIFKTPGLENCKELETNWLHMTTVFGDIHRWIVFIYCNSKIVSILYYSVPYKVCVYGTQCVLCNTSD